MTTTIDREVGLTILDQIAWGTKASLGYSKPRIITNGVAFGARILPFRKDGSRGSRARLMCVEIVLNGMDYYDITVTVARNVSGHALPTDAVHYEATDVDCFDLNTILLALDWNGDEVLNPRLA